MFDRYNPRQTQSAGLVVMLVVPLQGDRQPQKLAFYDGDESYLLSPIAHFDYRSGQ